MYFSSFVVNDELYFMSNKNVYHYTGGALSKITTLSNTASSFVCVKNGCLYFWDNNGNKSKNVIPALYKFNPTTLEETRVGTFEYRHDKYSVCFSDNQNDNIKWVSGKNGNLNMYEIIVVEE